MAFIQCNFYSKVLGFETSMNVILPGDSKSNLAIPGASVKTTYPTLYLLHGLSDDHTAWTRRSSIERYVRDLNIAIVMPDAGRSFYTDMEHGYDYFTFISEELPAMAESFFPLSSKREDRYIAGLSMGGYGALKIALSKPESFAAVASLSGSVDIQSIANQFIVEDARKNILEFNNVFGNINYFSNGPSDLFSLASKCSALDIKPKIYLACGTEDFLYSDNLTFKNHLSQLPFDFTYCEGPGNHDWNYWDAQIQAVINWLII